MTACTERHRAARPAEQLCAAPRTERQSTTPIRGLAGQGRKGMTERAES